MTQVSECVLCGEPATVEHKLGMACQACDESIKNGDLDDRNVEELLCSACSGSGMGYSDGSSCYPCSGTGVAGARSRREEDRAMAAEARYDEEMDERMLRGEK